MTEQQLLLANIIKNPEGDTERLVYADWLSEHGQEQLAEFIRLDIELHVFSNADPKNLYISDWDRGREAKARRNELWNDSHKRGWWNDIPGDWRATIKNKTQISTANSWDYLFDRGFVHTVSISADGFLKHADALIWHEGQKEVCHRCDGDGKAHGSDRPFEWSPHIMYGKCVVCKGSGKSDQPRPCPLTAHPIRKVVLTTRAPGIGSFEDYLADRWPGIEFVLPEQTVDVMMNGGLVTVQAAAPIHAGQLVAINNEGKAIPFVPAEQNNFSVGFAAGDSK